MASFYYFIPKHAGVQLLIEAGLEYAFPVGDNGLPSCAMKELSPDEGPDGLGGTCFFDAREGFVPRQLCWRAVSGQRSAVSQGDQAESRSLSADSYWLGWHPKALPGPMELRQAVGGDGVAVKLGDGREWMVPIVTPCERFERVDTLPRSFQFKNGSPEWGIDPQYDRLRFTAFCFLETARGKAGIRTPAELVAFCCELLAVHYRVRAEEVAALRLLTDVTARAMLEVALDATCWAYADGADDNEQIATVVREAQRQAAELCQPAGV